MRCRGGDGEEGLFGDVVGSVVMRKRKLPQLREKAPKIFMEGATAYIPPSHFSRMPESGHKAGYGPTKLTPFLERSLASAIIGVRANE